MPFGSSQGGDVSSKWRLISSLLGGWPVHTRPTKDPPPFAGLCGIQTAICPALSTLLPSSRDHAAGIPITVLSLVRTPDWGCWGRGQTITIPPRQRGPYRLQQLVLLVKYRKRLRVQVHSATRMTMRTTVTLSVSRTAQCRLWLCALGNI